MYYNDNSWIVFVTFVVKKTFFHAIFQVGFRLNHTIKVIGPIITFPKTVLSWHIESFERINADSLMIFGLIQPRIETLIIGAGADETSSSKLGQSVLEIMHKFKINVEILTTELVRPSTGASKPQNSFQYAIFFSMIGMYTIQLFECRRPNDSCSFNTTENR